MTATKGYAAHSATDILAPFNFDRREPNPHDVQFEILYCGVCHSDIHQVRNEWGNSKYPIVPGHEIVGRVTRVGSEVTKFKEGDLAAVGCLVDSCRECSNCKKGNNFSKLFSIPQTTDTMKSILIETANDEELKMVEDFVKEHKMKGFIVEDSKATKTGF